MKKIEKFTKIKIELLRLLVISVALMALFFCSIPAKELRAEEVRSEEVRAEEVRSEEVRAEEISAFKAGQSFALASKEQKGADISNYSVDTVNNALVSNTDNNEENGLKRSRKYDSCREINIVMVGDILLHDGIEQSARREDGSYDFTRLFENTKDVIGGADLAIVNQEVIIGGKELGISGYPSFSAPYEIGDALCEAGFDVICHGTNHALDKGKKGINNCLDYWETNHPDKAILGICNNETKKDDIYIWEDNGLRLAILNYTYGTNGIPMPKDMNYAVKLLDRDKIKADLEYAEENADFTIVCPHWGIEYELKQSSEQEKMAEFMVENGADLIIGTHPHVMEPVEWVYADPKLEESDSNLEREKAKKNKGLVYYSLGNYVNWTSGSGSKVSARMVGAIASVTLKQNKRGGVYIKSHETIPIVAHLEERRDGATVYKLSDYNEELARNNAIRKQDSSFSYERCIDIAREVLGSSYF